MFYSQDVTCPLFINFSKMEELFGSGENGGSGVFTLNQFN